MLVQVSATTVQQRGCSTRLRRVSLSVMLDWTELRHRFARRRWKLCHERPFVCEGGNEAGWCE
jgi:hypothetical protein